MKIKRIISMLVMVILLLTSCATSSETKKSDAPSPTPTKELSEAEKQAAEYEKIAQEALEKEHEHKWVLNGYQEGHPHSAEYTCECGAIRIVAHETAKFTMSMVGVSPEHPHYMLEECSICHQQFPNQNLPTELTWYISGYTESHPHYAILKCSQCEYTKTDTGITSESMGVSRLITEESTTEHPHYLIVKCDYPGCDHTYIEKNATDKWELLTDPENYSIHHPHHLFGTCSHDGCTHSELMDETADWTWKDGVCSICGVARDVKYDKDDVSTRVTGLVDAGFEGVLQIPSMIEGLPVTSIEPGSFRDGAGITEVYVPESVIFIGNHAFEGCMNLRTIHFESLVAPAIAPDSLMGMQPDTMIFVPIDSIGYDLPEWQMYNITYYELP